MCRRKRGLLDWKTPPAQKRACRRERAAERTRQNSAEALALNQRSCARYVHFLRLRTMSGNVESSAKQAGAQRQAECSAQLRHQRHQ